MQEVTNPLWTLLQRVCATLSFRWKITGFPSKAYKTPPTLFETLLNFHK